MRIRESLFVVSVAALLVSWLAALVSNAGAAKASPLLWVWLITGGVALITAFVTMVLHLLDPHEVPAAATEGSAGE